MNELTVRLAGGLLVVAVGVWAGTQMYAHHTSVRGAEGEATASRVNGSPGRRSDSPDLGGPPADVFDAPFDAALPPPKIPERLPAFSLADLTGKLTPISTWRDKSLIINFWATWCAPCRHEIPLLKALSSEWAAREVQVVGIAVDHHDPVVTYADQLKINYPILIGEQDALQAASALGFDSPVFPFSIFTDQRGEVVTLVVGELHRPQAELILSVVQDLNRNHMQIEQARRTIAERLHALAPSE